MANVSITFRYPEEKKRQLESICEELGMSMSTIFTVLANSVIRNNGLTESITLLSDNYDTPELTEEELLRRISESENGHSKVYSLEDDRKLIYGE